MRKRLLASPILFIVSAALATTQPANVRQYLDQGRADSALTVLNDRLGQNPDDAEGRNLRCRVYYQEEQWDQAVADCEAAVQLAQGNSNFHLWLGRAYGKKAEHASLISGYPLARKVHTEFEQAVQLDPKNAEALADLGVFDAMAPSVVGGGLARAEAVADQLGRVNPASALSLRGRIAESKKDYGAAENWLKDAIRESPYPANTWMDLAAFYRRRGRLDEMASAAHTGAALDAKHGIALVDGASSLAQAVREPQAAIEWLQKYLNSSAQSEQAPAFVVRAQLAGLLEKQGDTAGAHRQIAAVHALASGYRIPQGNAAARAAGR